MLTERDPVKTNTIERNVNEIRKDVDKKQKNMKERSICV